jgi:hypothetical protein
LQPKQGSVTTNAIGQFLSRNINSEQFDELMPFRGHGRPGILLKFFGTRDDIFNAIGDSVMSRKNDRKETPANHGTSAELLARFQGVPTSSERFPG